MAGERQWQRPDFGSGGVGGAPRKFSQTNFIKRLINWEGGGRASVRAPALASECIHQLKGLILAQNERWRRGLGMQVERDRFSHFVLFVFKSTR